MSAIICCIAACCCAISRIIGIASGAPAFTTFGEAALPGPGSITTVAPGGT